MVEWTSAGREMMELGGQLEAVQCCIHLCHDVNGLQGRQVEKLLDA